MEQGLALTEARMSWLDQVLVDRELVEYAVSRIPADWEVRSNGTVVGHLSGVGDRPSRGRAPRLKPRPNYTFGES